MEMIGPLFIVAVIFFAIGLLIGLCICKCLLRKRDKKKTEEKNNQDFIATEQPIAGSKASSQDLNDVKQHDL